MPLQRACDDENQARNKLSNGPRRVQSNAQQCAEYSATRRHASVAGNMLVFRKEREVSRNKVAPRVKD